jgi:hypothetical protein
MNLPPHIQNAPAPRSKTAINCGNWSVEMHLMERELLYAKEVMEKMVNVAELYQHRSNAAIAALSAYEQFKKDTEV